MAGAAGRRAWPTPRHPDPGRRRARAVLGAAGVLVGIGMGLGAGLGACIGSPAPGASVSSTVPPPVPARPGGASVPRASASGAATPPTGADLTPVPGAVPRDYVIAEAPHLVDRDAFDFRTLSAVRPGATYRLRMPGNLYPATPGSRLAVELTVSGAGWWLFEQGVVTQEPSYAREDAGVRVMELGAIPYGPCQDQQRPPADPGPTPTDLVHAIVTRYPLTVLEPVSPVARFGGSGVHLTVRLDDPKAGLCDNSGLMTYRPMASQHQLVELWIVMVRGERVVVERSWFADTRPDVLADQQRTLDSVRLVPL